jgi:hypothetical protein
VSWYPVEAIPGKGNIFEAAACVLFPNDPEGLQKVGRLNARESLTGLYRLFIRIPSIEFVIGRVAKLWRVYQDTGDANVEEYDGKSLQFVVRNFPDLREDFREYLMGYIFSVGELSGLKEVRVTHCADDPQAWKWKMEWK